MGGSDLLYADALASFDEAKIVFLGVTFDGTSSHRAGSAQAPNAIRKESYNFETWMPRYLHNIENVKMHDIGDAGGFANVEELINGLPGKITEVIRNKKFLITLGGEHSISIPIIKTIQDEIKDLEFGVICFDAHLDFRDSYLDQKFSHACVTRRITELIGEENVVPIGIRSYSAEEGEALKKKKLKFYSAESVQERGMKQVINEVLDILGRRKIYLSIDMDVFDPAYAPGVGNPEYFGLNPWQIREGIDLIGPYLIGADLVEVSPPYDNGNTAALAAQLIQIIIANISKH